MHANNLLNFSDQIHGQIRLYASPCPTLFLLPCTDKGCVIAIRRRVYLDLRQCFLFYVQLLLRFRKRYSFFHLPRYWNAFYVIFIRTVCVLSISVRCMFFFPKCALFKVILCIQVKHFSLRCLRSTCFRIFNLVLHFQRSLPLLLCPRYCVEWHRQRTCLC